MKTKAFFVMLLSCATLAACNVKLKSKDGEQKGPPPEPKVEGPNVQGRWVSACEFNSRDAGYRVLDVTFGPTTVSRQAHLYHDPQCLQLSKTEVKAGTYKYVSANKDGSYTMEYRIPVGDGVYALPKENMFLDNNLLYLSDFLIGDGISKSLMVSLQRRTQNP